jgi:hypothetical protein
MTTPKKYYATMRATRLGVMPRAAKMKCQQCGAQAAHRHHNDRAHPLRVLYLCARCHGEIEANLRKGVKPDLDEHDFSTHPQLASLSARDERLTFMAGGRKRKLFRLRPLGNWYIRFNVRGKDCERSTGTTIVMVAKENALRIIETAINKKLYGQSHRKRQSHLSYPESIQRVLGLLDQLRLAITLLAKEQQQ